MKYSFTALLSLMLLGTAAQNTYALDTALISPHTIAPFELCFITDRAGNWPSTFVSQNSPSCLDQNLTLTQYQTLTPFQKDIYRATAIWQSYFTSTHSVRINVRVNNTQPRFSATSMAGRISNQTLISANGLAQSVEVVAPSALTRLQSGEGNKQSDILINVRSLPTKLFNVATNCHSTLAPDTLSYCRQNDSRDIVSVILHELGHGYGIRSLRCHDQNYGNFFHNRISAFDLQTNNGDGYHDLLNNYQDYFSHHQHHLVFTGSSTIDYLTSQHWPAPLNICNRNKNEKLFSQNFSHFCFNSCLQPKGPHTQPDLMGMWCLTRGSKQKQIDITSLDLHVLSDIGYASVLKTTTAIPDLRTHLFDSTINS